MLQPKISRLCLFILSTTKMSMLQNFCCSSLDFIKLNLSEIFHFCFDYIESIQEVHDTIQNLVGIFCILQGFVP